VRKSAKLNQFSGEKITQDFQLKAFWIVFVSAVWRLSAFLNCFLWKIAELWTFSHTVNFSIRFPETKRDILLVKISQKLWSCSHHFETVLCEYSTSSRLNLFWVSSLAWVFSVFRRSHHALAVHTRILSYLKNESLLGRISYNPFVFIFCVIRVCSLRLYWWAYVIQVSCFEFLGRCFYFKVARLWLSTLVFFTMIHKKSDWKKNSTLWEYRTPKNSTRYFV